MKTFSKWLENLNSPEVMVVTGDSVHATRLDGSGRPVGARTFIDQGNWVKNVRVTGSDPFTDKPLHSMEVSFDNGKSWFTYETKEMPGLKPLA